MNWFPSFGFRRRRRELQEEIDAHLQMAITDRVARGESKEVARQAAISEFGNVPLMQDVTREMWGWMWLEQLGQDLRYTLRQMRRAPGFAATVVGTLALGIGAAAAMFSVVDQMLLRPVDFRDASQLFLMNARDRAGKASSGLTWLDIEELKRGSRSFEQIGFSGSGPGSKWIEGSAAILQVSEAQVSPDLFSILGVNPAIGSGFVQEEPRLTAGKNAGAIVLSHAVWTSAFNRDRNVVGKVVRMNRNPYTVVGVMPSGFRYPNYAFDDQLAQVWTVVRLGSDDAKRTYKATTFDVIGRLRRGITLPVAKAEMMVIEKTLAAEYPDDPGLREWHATVSLQQYTDTLIGTGVRKALIALLLASGTLWLIASVNVTNLLLARSANRQKEIAVRGALGASRWLVMQQMLVESLALSGVASTIGVVLALGGIRVAESVRPRHLNLHFSAHPNSALLAMLCGLTLLSGLLCAAWPTFIALRAPVEALKQGGLQTGTGRRHNRARSALVVVEVAMSLALLVTCGILLRTIYFLRHAPLGYRTDHILVANLNIPSFRFEGKNIRQAFYRPLLDRVQNLRGVQAAGFMTEVPLGDTNRIHMTLRINGRDVSGLLKPVTPGIQQVFGFAMAAGRFFNTEDTPMSMPVAVVNSAFAKLYAPEVHDPKSIIGSKFKNFGKDTEIIGILNSQRQMEITDNSQPEMEVCLCQLMPGDASYSPSTVATDLAMRTEQPTSVMIPELRAILRQASPELEGSSIKAMERNVEDSYESERLAAHLLEIFGSSAFLLCLSGIYGLLAYVVAQRTREMGVRIALGAQRGNLAWLIMRQASMMLLVGVAAGTGLALATGRLVRSFLYGVSPQDGWALAGAAILLTAGGLMAASLPALRAARVNPMEALRAE